MARLYKLSFNHHFLCHDAAAKHLECVDACWQMAYIDGALTFDGEIHHFLSHHIKNQHTDGTLFVVGANGELMLGRIRIDVRLESGPCLDRFHSEEHVFVVTEADYLAGNTKDWVVGSCTIGASRT